MNLDFIREIIPSFGTIKNLMTGRFTYTVDFSRGKWNILMSDIERYFPHLPKPAMRIIRQWSIYLDKDATDDTLLKEGTFYDICSFNGTKILLTWESKTSKNDNSRSYFEWTFSLSCLNRQKDIDNLKLFIKKLVKRKDRHDELSSMKYINFIGVDNRAVVSKKKHSIRTFNDVFIPNEIKSDIIKSITSFIKSKKWYEVHNVPYHFGLMLYGPPGTGKSSIIKAITEQFEVATYYISGGKLIDALKDNDEWLNMIQNEVKPSIIVVEDIDTYEFLWKTELLRDDVDSTIRASLLSKLLNILDGVDSPSNTIWIFTTNHPERLNEAMIRPGRIDKKLEIGYVTAETMNEFLMHHFGHGLPNGFEVKGGMTFAAMQTDIMSGATFDEIVAKYCE